VPALGSRPRRDAFEAELLARRLEPVGEPLRGVRRVHQHSRPTEVLLVAGSGRPPGADAGARPPQEPFTGPESNVLKLGTFLITPD